MRFQSQNTFEYSIKFIGSPDLPMVWRLQKEWYVKHCPLVTFKELARERYDPHPTSVDRLWNEPACGTLIFHRRLLVRSHVVFPADEDKHTKRGVEEIRNDTFYFGLNLLEEADLYPYIGDHIVFSGVEYVVQKVKLDPENFWGHTNIPLHVTCNCERYRYGDARIPTSLDAMEM